MNSNDSGLLQYSYTDTNNIVAYCAAADRLPTLINYLMSNNIALVNNLPQSTGLFCVKEDNIYKVYTIYLDNESGIYINEYQYSLDWISILCNTSIKKGFTVSFGGCLCVLQSFLKYDGKYNEETDIIPNSIGCCFILPVSVKCSSISWDTKLGDISTKLKLLKNNYDERVIELLANRGVKDLPEISLEKGDTVQVKWFDGTAPDDSQVTLYFT